MIGIAGMAWEKDAFMQQTEPAFQFLTTDSILIDVFQTMDASGLPAAYRAHILSPVCEDGSCYEVELDFSWNLLGKFSHFEIDPAKPLTKLDHIPFDAADYEKLNRILHTPSPSFIHLRRSELVAEPTGNGDVDGMTGATVKAIKKDMVPGAIYTCYTLWHIANGGIVFNIQEHTRKLLTPPLIEKMLGADDAEMHYFLIENLEARYYTGFLEKILSLADRYDAFFAARIGGNLPQEYFSKPEVQTFFRQHFPRLDYAAQNDWIAKLGAAVTVDRSTLDFLVEQIPADNPARATQIIQLLIDKTAAGEKAIFDSLFSKLLEREVRLSSQSLEALQVIADGDRRFNKMYKRLNKY